MLLSFSFFFGMYVQLWRRSFALAVIRPVHFGLSAQKTVTLTHRFIVIFTRGRSSAAESNLQFAGVRRELCYTNFALFNCVYVLEE